MSSAPVEETPALSNPPRSRKGKETRARLVKAAKEVFEQDGFLDARILDIAKRADVSYGAFYHYFESKEQVFREVAEAQEQRLTAPPDEPDHQPGDESFTPFDRIRAATRRYLERYRSEAQIMRVIEQVSRYDAHVNAARMASQHHFADRSEAAIRRWQAEGLCDTTIDPAVAADALGSMVGRFAELWLTQGYGNYDFDVAAEQLSRLWANALGLQVPAPTPPAPRRLRPAGRKATGTARRSSAGAGRKRT